MDEMYAFDLGFLNFVPPVQLSAEEIAQMEKIYKKRDWTQEEVRQTLPKLRSMAAIENAWLDIERDCLVIRTRKGKLKHKDAFFPISQVDIRIPLRGKTWREAPPPKFKHVGGAWAQWLHPHPTMGKRRIGGDTFTYHCIGEYIYDYHKAHEKDVYETVIVLLTMLQTIKAEGGGRPIRTTLPWLLLIWFLFCVGLSISLIYLL